MWSRLILALSYGVLVPALAVEVGPSSTQCDQISRLCGSQNENVQPIQQDLAAGGEQVRKRPRILTDAERLAAVNALLREYEREVENEMPEGRPRKRRKSLTAADHQGLADALPFFPNLQEEVVCDFDPQQQVQAAPVPAQDNVFLLAESNLALIKKVEELQRRIQQQTAHEENQQRMCVKALQVRCQQTEALERQIEVLKRELGDWKRKEDERVKEEEKEFSKIRILRKDLPVGHEYWKHKEVEDLMAAKIAEKEAEMQAKLLRILVRKVVFRMYKKMKKLVYKESV